MKFHHALGFSINNLFTDEDQKCMISSDSKYIMLQSRNFSNFYVNKSAIDARKSQILSFTLPVEIILKVNEMMEQGLKAGGTEQVATISDDFMYLRSIKDVDGYIWNIMYLDVDRFKSIKRPND